MLSMIMVFKTNLMFRLPLVGDAIPPYRYAQLIWRSVPMVRFPQFLSQQTHQREIGLYVGGI